MVADATGGRALDARPPVLFTDIETSSACDIRQAGGYAYTQHPSTIVYCIEFAIATCEKDVRRFSWKPGEELAPEVRRHIEAGGPVVAHNYAFERSVWLNLLVPFHDFPEVDLEQWLDTQAISLAYNLPRTLGGAGRAVGCQVEKDKTGQALMKRMAKAVPNGEGGWTYDRDPAHLAQLVAYCWDDVRVTVELFYRLPPLHPFEALTWRCDMRINDRGVFLDQAFAARCLQMADARKKFLADVAFTISEGMVANPVGVPAMKSWLTNEGIVLPTVVRRNVKGISKKTPTMDRNATTNMLADPDLAPNVRAMLEARIEAGKLTSLAKMKRVQHMVGADGRLRFALHYAGANTNRWTSSGLQLHNLPKNKMAPDESEAVYNCIELGSLETLQMILDVPLEGLSQSLRSVIVATPGHDLIAADYSAIEGRVVAWLAGQSDILDLFERGEDVYVYAAAKVGSTNRQLGKVMTLALGYQMGAIKFRSQAAGYGVDLSLKEANKLKGGWRKANSEIVSFWYEVEDAARTAVATKETQTIGFLRFVCDDYSLRMVLPSGRSIYYHRPHIRHTVKRVQIVNDEGEIETKEIEGDELRFWTVGPDKDSMVVDSTYGGKLVENATQAVARDLLAEALHRFDRTLYDIVVHVHDSAAAEVPEGQGDLAEFERMMAIVPTWAPGLPIAVEGYRGKRFLG